jgi:predicted Zn finger-like uncharacterized protein
MLIVCPNCATSYQVEPNSLGQDGRSVRCARCRNVWFATVPAAMSAMAGSDEWDVIDSGTRVSKAGSRAESPAAFEGAPADFTAPADIDIAGLGAAIDTVRAGQETEAGAVPAEAAERGAAVDSPSLVPSQMDAAAAPPPGLAEDIETFVARRARREALRRRQWLRPRLPAVILILLAANAGLLAWRADIVRLLPQTAPLYAAVGLPVNLRGLVFDDIHMSRIDQDGVAVLVVEGSIVNATGRPVEVPRLRLAMRNEAGQEIYAWTALPSRSILAPGDTLPFRSRLASPPADGHEVKVRFFTRRDAVAGLN